MRGQTKASNSAACIPTEWRSSSVEVTRSMAELICVKCKVVLVEDKTELRYLGHILDVKALRCPKCGQVCFSQELVEERISEAEMTLEDK
jgi:hypothetical protein